MKNEICLNHIVCKSKRKINLCNNCKLCKNIVNLIMNGGSSFCSMNETSVAYGRTRNCTNAYKIEDAS